MKNKNTNRRERRHTTQDGLFLVEGESAVSEYLRFRPEAIQEFLYKSGQEGTLSALRKKFQHRIETPAIMADAHTSSPIAARIKLSMTSMESWFSRCEEASKPKLVLALDHIQDPRNLGAIVRSAAFFGVHHVLLPNRRQVLLSQAAVATAQGGFALVELIQCVNVARALEEMKDRGYWVLGADMDGESVAGLRDFYDHAVLVLGSEDKGISALVRKKCDRMVSISGPVNSLESLNVSVAAGIMLSHLLGR